MVMLPMPTLSDDPVIMNRELNQFFIMWSYQGTEYHFEIRWPVEYYSRTGDDTQRRKAIAKLQVLKKQPLRNDVLY